MKKRIYIGNSSDRGIGILDFYSKNKSTIKYNNDEIKCTYFKKNKRNIYSVIEVSDENNQNEGYIVKYKIKNNMLIKQFKITSGGKNPCCLDINSKQNLIAVGNYSDGKLIILKENTKKNTNQLIYESKEKNAKIHCVKFLNRFLLVVDIGNDKIIIYKILKNKINKIMEYKFAKGTEPRQVEIKKNEIYIITEKTHTLYILKIQNGNIQIKQKIKIDCNNSTGCALKLDRNNKTIYVTIRGENIICIYKKKNNKWVLVQKTSSYGELPWDICIDKFSRYVYVANAKTKNISIFLRNRISGRLKFCQNIKLEISPTCIQK